MYSYNLYKHAPIFLQNYFVSAHSSLRDVVIKRGKYKYYIDSIFATQWFSVDEMREYQNDQLYNILLHCNKHITFYKQFLPRSIKSYRDDIFSLIKILPFIDKQVVLKNFNKFVRKSIIPKFFYGSTSGTTGTPLKIYQDYNTVVRESAFVARQMQWAGYRNREPYIWIRGDMVVPATSLSGPYWRMDYHRNALVMSAYHLSPETCESYIAAIESFRPVLVCAYPSAIGALAQYLDCVNRDLRCSTIRSIIVSSETLTPSVQKVVEKRFGAKIFNWYGSFERIGAIGTCEYGSLHVLTDYSYTEFIPQQDGSFKLCGSTFQNFTMPLLRYMMNDKFTGYSDEVVCKCGRHFPVIQSILGRDDDYIYTQKGYAVGRLGHIFKGVGGILGAQLVQDHVGEVTIFIVPSPGSAKKDYVGTIIRNAHQRLGEDMQVSVRLVPALQKTSNGKIKFVISNLKPGSN